MCLGHDFHSCKMAHPPSKSVLAPAKVYKQKEKSSENVPPLDVHPSNSVPDKAPSKDHVPFSKAPILSDANLPQIMSVIRPQLKLIFLQLFKQILI